MVGKEEWISAFAAKAESFRDEEVFGETVGATLAGTRSAQLLQQLRLSPVTTTTAVRCYTLLRCLRGNDGWARGSGNKSLTSQLPRTW